MMVLKDGFKSSSAERDDVDNNYDIIDADD